MTGPAIPMGGLFLKHFGSSGNNTAETNGITVNFFKLSGITSGRTKVPEQEHNLIDEIIFSEI